MFSSCPRCDSGKLDATGTCVFCGYTLRVLCVSCTTANIPTAKFCGGCGRGMTFTARATRFINSHISYLQQLKLRKFMAGASFGALVAIFAFGTMGMQSSSLVAPTTAAQITVTRHYVSSSKLAQSINKEISEWLSINAESQFAEVSHLIGTTNIILKHLGPVAKCINGNRTMASSADEYLKLLNNFSKSGILTRGSAAIIVFNLLSDFMGFTYRDFKDTGLFSDIPKYHFLSIPATALKQFGIVSENQNREFGPAEAITLHELNEMTKAIMSVAELHIKEKVFSSLPPTLQI